MYQVWNKGRPQLHRIRNLECFSTLNASKEILLHHMPNTSSSNPGMLLHIQRQSKKPFSTVWQAHPTASVAPNTLNKTQCRMDEEDYDHGLRISNCFPMKAAAAAIHPEPKLKGQKLIELLPGRTNPLTDSVKIPVQKNTVQQNLYIADISIP